MKANQSKIFILYFGLRISNVSSMLLGDLETYILKMPDLFHRNVNVTNSLLDK